MSVLKNPAADVAAAALMKYAGAMNKACRELEGKALCDAVGEATDDLNLSQALAFMNVLMAGTEDGMTVYEFPDACFKAAAKYGVKYEDLADAYDAYCADIDAAQWQETCEGQKRAEQNFSYEGGGF